MKRAIGPRADKFIKELRTFCKEKRGRSQALAKFLNMSPQHVYQWWSATRFPTLEQALGIQEWLKDQS